MQSSPDVDVLYDRIARAQKALGALAPPSDVAAWVAQTADRRQREQALLEALAALGAVSLAARGEPRSAVKVAPPVEVPAPPTPVAVAERGPAVEVTEDLLGDLQRRLSGAEGRAEEDSAEVILKVVAATDSVIKEALERLGQSPELLDSSERRAQEGQRLRQISRALLAEWGQVQQEANFVLTSWATCRLRALQDAYGVEGGLGGELVVLFGLLVNHSRQSRPGVVRGLSRKHRPRESSWTADAQVFEAQLHSLAGIALPEPPVGNLDDALRRLTEAAAEGHLEGPGFCAQAKRLVSAGLSATDRRLVRLAVPFAGDLDGKRLAPLRRAVREALSDAEGEEAARPPVLPPDWPHFEHTRGKVALIVGGEPRPERVARLREAFGFKDLDWLDNPTQGVRALDGVVQRMHSGSLDLVIVLRAFSSHKVSDKIFAARDGACAVILADTYGINQVRFGIERFLGGGRG